MGSEWQLSSLWLHSSKSIPLKATPYNQDKAEIGVLASEVSCLMSRVAHLWHFLRDQEITKLREEIKNSIGIRSLISEDADYLMNLVLNETLDSFQSLARSVGILGKKCTDPLFARFEQFAYHPFENNAGFLGWDYRLKKMERKVKKMERFALTTMQLIQEKELLNELEQSLRRMKANPELRRGKLTKFQQKVTWKRQEVEYLHKMSPWVRTHDYVVRLLARSLLTIFKRIMQVFSVTKLPVKTRVNRAPPIHPSENISSGIFSPPLGISDRMSKLALGRSKHGSLDALALRYGNVIVCIEKLTSSPHMINFETRGELYNMLPTSIRWATRTRFKTRDVSSSEAELRRILEWLSPLAHDTVRWHLDRSFERQRLDFSGTNVLLVQTLHYADRAKTEAAIVDLLVGLSFLFRANGKCRQKFGYSSM